MEEKIDSQRLNKIMTVFRGFANENHDTQFHVSEWTWNFQHVMFFVSLQFARNVNINVSWETVNRFNLALYITNVSLCLSHCICTLCVGLYSPDLPKRFSLSEKKKVISFSRLAYSFEYNWLHLSLTEFMLHFTPIKARPGLVQNGPWWLFGGYWERSPFHTVPLTAQRFH